MIEVWNEEIARADKFRLARKRLTYKQRVYCPHDGRLIAAVVDASDVLGTSGEYLWVVGGHVGQTAAMRDKYAEGIEWAAGIAETHPSPEARDFRRRWADALRNDAQHLQSGREVPALAYPMHTERAEYDAPCRGCHRDTRVTPDRGFQTLNPESL